MSKHATKYNISVYYKRYINALELQIAPVETERREIYMIKCKIYDKIAAHDDEIQSIRGLMRFLTSIKYSPVKFTSNKYAKFKSMCNARLSKELAMNCITIMDYTKHDLELLNKLRSVTAALIPFNVYKKILDAYYNHISNAILRGYVFNVGPHIGSIYIQEVYKKMVNSLGEVRPLVDHAASAELLDTIAKSQEEEGIHTLYTDYKIRHYYTRNQFIHLMKPYTYSHTNKHLPKWIVYHTDDWIPYFRWGNRDNTMSALNLYTFKPTGFINTPKRRTNELLKDVTCVEDIIQFKEIGAKDKMFLIRRFDNNYYINTRK